MAHRIEIVNRSDDADEAIVINAYSYSDEGRDDTKVVLSRGQTLSLDVESFDYINVDDAVQAREVSSTEVSVMGEG